MDDVKDIQKTDQVSRFLDNHPVRTNPFGENKTGERAYRRAERIVAALHLLTNHIKESEPIRPSIRAEANTLLGEVLNMRDEMRAAQSRAAQEVQISLRKLISYVRILTVSGFISMQNAGTMIEALDELGSFLVASRRTALSESFVLSREELLDARHMPSVRQSVSVTQQSPALMSDTKDTAGKREESNTAVRMSNGGADHNVRAQQILAILRESGVLGIRELAAHLPEYSEKMIQRELASLTSRGEVKKTGLKRWSRYEVAAK